MIWRYDPILFTHRYTPAYHLRAFGHIADALRGFTSRCVISFVDDYAQNAKSMAALRPYMLPDSELTAFAGEIARIAEENGMKVGSCAEKIDLPACGIEHNCCIDKKLIEQITGCRIARRTKIKTSAKSAAALRASRSEHTIHAGTAVCIAMQTTAWNE